MKKYLIAIVVIIALALIAWRSGKVPVLNNLLSAGDGQPVACTMEAKQCPDGSYVGRTGPKCEFAACPSVGVKNSWQTYKNEQYGFEFQYSSQTVVTEMKNELRAKDEIRLVSYDIENKTVPTYTGLRVDVLDNSNNLPIRSFVDLFDSKS